MSEVIKEKGRKLPLNMRCLGCGYAEVVEYDILSSQKIKNITWHCPRCGDKRISSVTINE